MNKPIIECRDVWKTYTMGENKVHALAGFNLKIERGEFLAIMGPSGSGKSTAMNMVGCLDIPTRGQVFLNGRDIASFTESELAQTRGKNIGFIFQQFNLINTLSAAENIMLPMMFQGVPKEQRIKRAEELLTLVELKDRMHHRPNELSGGQQQRVAIARSLVNDPEILLADEPTGNLDSKTGQTVLSFLKQLHKDQKKTIVMVTHDSDLAKRAQRTQYLMDGKIVR
ncbi:MAG: ABC transporter ATP-binding protein [Nanoarchaeota archaeon]